jgi:hypothetical protein
MNSLTKKTVSILLSSIVFLSSCSTIMQGSRQSVTIQSLTPDARILVNGDDMGRDIVTTKLKRNTNHTIMIKKDGFDTKTVSLGKNVQAGYVVADVVIALTGLGLIWIIVDAATGSWHKFDKDKVVVELEEKK